MPQIVPQVEALTVLRLTGMSTDQSFVDYVCEQASLGVALTSRKMFGEYALYFGGKVVALICDNSVFLKPTVAGRALLKSATESPPYPGAKPHFVVDEILDDRELLQLLIKATTRELPEPKLKKPKVRKPSPKRNIG